MLCTHHSFTPKPFIYEPGTPKPCTHVLCTPKSFALHPLDTAPMSSTPLHPLPVTPPSSHRSVPNLAPGTLAPPSPATPTPQPRAQHPGLAAAPLSPARGGAAAASSFERGGRDGGLKEPLLELPGPHIPTSTQFMLLLSHRHMEEARGPS